MFDNTLRKILAFCIVSFLIISFCLSGCGKSIANFFSGTYRETAYVYSDMPADMIPTAKFNAVISSTDTYGQTFDVKYSLIPNFNEESISSDMPIFVNDYKPFEAEYTNKTTVGYYSLAFMADYRDSFIGELCTTHKNKLGYSTYMLDFNGLLTGFLEGKSYKDLGYDIDGKIQIYAIYTDKNDIYYRLIESQILYELTGISNQTEEDFENHRTEIDSIMTKISKAPSEFDKNAIYIGCEQSRDFVALKSGRGYSCYEYHMACEPLYMMYNDSDKWQNTIKTLTEGNYRDDNIAATSRLRTPMDIAHSTAHTSSIEGMYMNMHSLDSVQKILRK